MIKPIPINKGVYLDLNPVEITSTEYATVLKNLILSKSGANVDRPDLTPFATTGSSLGITALNYFNNFLVAIDSGGQIYKITIDGTVTNITGAGPLLGTSRAQFAQDGFFLAIAGGLAPKVWDGIDNCIDMPGSPPNLRFIDYLDGYWIAFQIDTQLFQYAGPTADERLVWGADDFFSAEGTPDVCLSQWNLNRELYAIKQQSMETFQDFGAVSDPFQRTFFIDRGTIAPYSIVQADNTLWFLDNERHFVKLVNRVPTFISDAIDKVLKDPTFVVEDCFGMKIEIDGFYLIAWVFPTMGRTFVMDYRTGEWAEWNSFVDGKEVTVNIGAHYYVQAWGKHMVGDPSTGTIYELTRSAKGTVASPLRRVRRTGQYDHGMGTRKRSNFYLFHMLRGQGTPGQPEPVFEVRVNDDSKGWSDPVQIGLGFLGEEQAPIRVRLGGIYRKRELEITTTAPVDFSLVKLEEDVEEMAS